MSDWKENDLEKVKVTIEIPKNTMAFVVNTLSRKNGVISMTNTQYDSNDVERLLGESDE